MRFEITKNHLKLLKHAYTGWNDCEFGAASIDCKRPYGDSNVYGSMMTIPGWATKVVIDGKVYEYDAEEMWNNTDKLAEKLNKLHEDLRVVLQICFERQKFETGIYETAEDWHASGWRKVDP